MPSIRTSSASFVTKRATRTTRRSALAEIEEEADEYRKIAERRVRLGLLLSEIGAGNGVDVTEQEMQRLIMQAASQYQGKDRENFVRYVQQEPMAAAQLRAPLYEDKVVDFLFAKAKVTDRKAPAPSLRPISNPRKGMCTGPAAATTTARLPSRRRRRRAAKGKAKARRRGRARCRGARQGPGRKGFGQAQAGQAAEGRAGQQGAWAKAEAKPDAKPKAKKAPAKKA